MYRKIKSCLSQLFIGKVIQPINSAQTAVKLEDLNLDAINQPVYVEMPIVHLRGFMELGAPMELGKGNPFVETAKALIDNPNIPDIETPLAAFYKNFQPKNAAELLGLNNSASKLISIPTWQAQLPWDSCPSTNIEIYRKEAMKSQAHQYGLNLSWTDGYNCFGPVTPKKLGFEITRLKEIISSINARGFNAHTTEDPISARLMIGREKKLGLIREGNHRASVLAAFAFKKIPVLVHPSIITLNKIHIEWPSVRHGFLSEADARLIFERVEKGQLPFFV